MRELRLVHVMLGPLSLPFSSTLYIYLKFGVHFDVIKTIPDIDQKFVAQSLKIGENSRIFDISVNFVKHVQIR